jgi:hypothetical protein
LGRRGIGRHHALAADRHPGDAGSGGRRGVRPDHGLQPLVEDVVAAKRVRDADEAGEDRANGEDD